MSKTNLLTGSQIASFTPDSGELLPVFGVSTGSKIELHTFLQRITDTRGPRVVVHEFPYRDGASIETLGRKPHRTQWDLTFVGKSWRDTLLSLVKAIDASPSGLLVHPIYGQMRVVCHGIDPSVVDIVNATDTVTLSLTFTEDATDQALDQQGASAKQQDVSNASTAFQTASAIYKSVAAAQAVAGLVASAVAFSDAAVAAATTNFPDPSLGGKLDAVGAALALAEIALSADPVALTSVAQVYDALASAEVLYAACIDLSDEVALETTGFSVESVDGDTSVAVLLGAKYGSRALSVMDAFLRLNADKIRDATSIPAGTELIYPL